MAKIFIPGSILRQLSQHKVRYERTTHPFHLKLQPTDFSDLLNKPATVPATPPSFLFVCFGNIMRSPMCEALMKRAIAGRPKVYNVLSAGLNAEPGRRAHPWAISAASELGISLEDHRARALSQQMVDDADAIFIMDSQNLDEIKPHGFERHPSRRHPPTHRSCLGPCT